MSLSVIIPANNETDWIGRCLAALIAQQGLTGMREIIVAANGCTDDTVALAEAHRAEAEAAGWQMTVLDIAEGNKAGALNRADQVAQGAMRAYLDADVVLSAQVLAQIVAVLDRPDPAYASGRLVVAPAASWITRAYARFWSRLPFMTRGVPGAGLFAVNAPGRARWGEFPAIISDDTYVRLSFAPEERHGVPAPYEWPMVEGFANLVRVRARQDAGVDEVRAQFAHLIANEDTARPGLAQTLGLALRDPVGFGVYAAVSRAVRRARHAQTGWERGTR